MRKHLALLSASFLAYASVAHAQSNAIAVVKSTNADGSYNLCAVGTSSCNVPVTGGSGGSSAAFTPNGNAITQQSVTSSSGSIALPAGNVVLVQNTGTTNGLTFKLGVGSATATNNDIYVGPGAGCAVVVGTNTFIGFKTASSTTTLNVTGGDGLGACPTGGGGGSGGGAVTIASGGVASGAYASGSIASGAIVDGADVTLGTKADAATCATTNTAIACLRQMDADIQGAPAPGSSGGLTSFSKIIANNTTSFAIDASPGRLYEIDAYNNSATLGWLKLYNAAQGSTTCGSGTPILRIMVPGNSTSGAGVVKLSFYGTSFSTAITGCFVTGIADADATSPAATTYVVNVGYK